MSEVFDRAKFSLFKFLVHQIHPFAFGVKSFLQPVLDDCLLLIPEYPQETWTILLKITQVFTTFVPEDKFIYDDLRKFAVQLIDAMQKCSKHLASELNTIDGMDSAFSSLETFINRKDCNDTAYIDMYKNFCDIWKHVEKIQSMENLSISVTDSTMDNVQQDKKAIINNWPEETDDLIDLNDVLSSEKTMSIVSAMNNSDRSMKKSDKSLDESMSDCSEKKFSVSSIFSYEDSPTKGVCDHSENDVAIVKQSIKCNETLSNLNDDSFSKISEQSDLSSTLWKAINDDRWKTKVNLTSINQQTNILSTLLPAQHESSRSSSDKIEQSELWSNWFPSSNERSGSCDHYESLMNTKHITDKYLYLYGTKQKRPVLRATPRMTYRESQQGSRLNSLPIGIALSNDESILFSCDVHHMNRHIRIFDTETGQLRHKIAESPNGRLKRPSAVIATADNNVAFVDESSIYLADMSGRSIQILNHESTCKLYGIGQFHDRYLLTLDCRPINDRDGELCRLLLFDPKVGQLAFKREFVMNRQPKEFFKSQPLINHVQGQFLLPKRSKPRFLAVDNDHIYISDLGRSLIYGATLNDECTLIYTSVFGGLGRADGELNEPSGLCTDLGGNIISADSKNDRIQLFSSNGKYRATIRIFQPIKRPSGLCMNRDGSQVYVSCYLGGCIQAFDLNY